ncbi:MAG: hypothetical protein QG657_841 [Acidobacteriota bacterium]|nr:hypothetical protein [Acidobacteriota bacterium]
MWYYSSLMNRIGCFIIPVLLVVFLSGCQDDHTKTASLPSPELEQEEYNVYSSLLNGNSYVDDHSITIISDYTIPVSVIDVITYYSGSKSEILRTRYYLWGFFDKMSIAEIGEDTLEDFEQKNQHHYPLNYKFNIKKKYLLLSHEEFMDNALQRANWDDLRSVYPDSSGVFTFSRVGFNSTRDKAIVYQGWWEGWRFSFGYIILLYKVKNVWILEKRMPLWG